MLNHSLASTCLPETFTTPAIFGAEILSLAASWVTNYTLNVPATFNYNHGDVGLNNTRFCNVTVTYTHPGHEDLITVETWLPQQWNQRLQATGGGGWNAGRFVLSDFFMAGAIGEGYAATTTDAGLGRGSSPNSWALKSPGNVNLYDVQNLGYVSLNDQAIISKDLGGRQGLVLAQRYPTAYDGIAASAPALSFTELAASVYYPLLVQKWSGSSASPLPCELEFITTEAIAHCDAGDGIMDGVISDPATCDFNALSAVNRTFNCSSTGKAMKVSNIAALVANAAWSGPRKANGDPLWYGFNHGSDITSFGADPGVNSSISSDLWFRLFVEKDTRFDSSTLSPLEYERHFKRGVQEYAGLLNADSPDLTEFKNAGGKLISYHGMADESIPTRSSEHYYRSVSDAMSDVQSFYRYFEAPGLGHCSGGTGGQPVTTFNSLRRWVEEGVAPETLPVHFKGTDGKQQARILCPYPAKAVYQGGGTSNIDHFKCITSTEDVL
ncbi:putative feruloyl esterase [Aspergillus melleus]|uniref:putative feruloyl esterase n=1 Tax=Aspergillus melleus TaxID=138277 RepID=UPI001E8E503C|nr:uncharacterized protein LDX57_002006 [Aspergillus melleus]KAH8424251.1 hypothetical protein LDX57_002006 [Aspergillus melleus]